MTPTLQYIEYAHSKHFSECIDKITEKNSKSKNKLYIDICPDIDKLEELNRLGIIKGLVGLDPGTKEIKSLCIFTVAKSLINKNKLVANNIAWLLVPGFQTRKQLRDLTFKISQFKTDNNIDILNLASETLVSDRILAEYNFNPAELWWSLND